MRKLIDRSQESSLSIMHCQHANGFSLIPSNFRFLPHILQQQLVWCCCSLLVIIGISMKPSIWLMVINQQAQKGEGTDRVSQVVLWLTGAPTLMKKKLPMFNNLSGDRKNVVVGLTTENNRDAKKQGRKKELLKKIAHCNQSPKLILNSIKNCKSGMLIQLRRVIDWGGREIEKMEFT